MKSRKLISMIAAVSVVMTNAAMISLPTAFAMTDEDTRTFTEDFEGMDITVEGDADSQKATIDALIDDGWYPVDNNKAYMNVDTSQSVYQFATVMGDDSNHYLRLHTPKSSTANYKLGLGRLFPVSGTSAKGIWEIDFKFKPHFKAGVTPAQFNFSMNTYLNQTLTEEEEKIAQHNIISAYNNKMYLGYRDYYPLYEGAGIPQGRLDGNLPLDWYDVKVIVNCDARYYSVALSHNGELFARRSPINFDGDETIGFFKMSALGMGTPAAVYVDDITIKPATEETLIYNEDFEAFSASDPVEDGMTTGGEEEDVSGHSYFEGFTPWRAYKVDDDNICNSYEFVDDPELGSQVVRLGGGEKGSGLVYIPALEKLSDVTIQEGSQTQKARGMVKTSFKIKAEDIASSIKVNAIGNYTQDITADNSIAFEIADNNGTPAVKNGEENAAELDTETWYNVDLVFDVAEGTAATTVTDINGEEIASFVKDVDTVKEVNALKGIMFNVPADSSVLMDDVVIEYCTAAAEPTEEPAPVVGPIAAVDKDSNPITDIENVPMNLWAIRIPFGCTLDPATANTDTIKVVDEQGNEIAYRGTTSGAKAYTLYFEDDQLEEGMRYQITIPATVANTAGLELGEEFKFKFKMEGTAEEPAPVVGPIAVVDRSGNPVTDINNVPMNLWAIKIPFGCTLDPETANKDTIAFVSEHGDKIDYRAEIEKNSYFIYLDEEGVLTEGTQYQITVPGTVANTAGVELGDDRVIKFKTEGDAPEPTEEPTAEPAPVMGTIAAVDKSGNQVTDKENVPMNLWAIKIPFGCTLDPKTANKDTITLVSEAGKKIDYRAKIEKGAYFIYLDERVLESNTKYQITIPATVANTAGLELGEEQKFKFKMTASIWGLMEISSVKVGENVVESISDIAAGATVNVEVSSEGEISGDAVKAVMVFRDRDADAEIVKLLIGGQTTEEGETSFAFEVPSDVDMEAIDEVSVFLWDSFGNGSPYCEKVSITK